MHPGYLQASRRRDGARSQRRAAVRNVVEHIYAQALAADATFHSNFERCVTVEEAKYRIRVIWVDGLKSERCLLDRLRPGGFPEVTV